MHKDIQEKIIIGIDPGTNVTGYGVIEAKGSKIKLIDYGVIKLDSTDEQTLKLKSIFESVTLLLEKFLPDEMAIEAPFFGKNIQSALKLGRAQGVAMTAALVRQIPIFEYSPKKIKQSVTGNGNASKEQVAKMLMQLLRFEEEGKLLDATDALGTAVCHFYQKGATQKKSGGWGTFLKENPDRKL